MFKFLKEKIKNTLSKISRKVEEQPVEQVKEQFEEFKVEEPITQTKEHIEVVQEEQKEQITKEEINILKQEPEIIQIKKTEEIIEKEKPLEEVKEKKGLFTKLKEKIIHEKPKEEFKEAELKEKPKEKKKFFESVKEKITTTKISEEKFEELFEDLELALLDNNVAFDVAEKIKSDLKEDIVDKPIKRGEVELEIKKGLKESIEDLFLTPKLDLIKKIREKEEKPFVICFLGQNGSGKTTSIAKLAHLLKQNNLSVVLSASDTFRAAAIQQLKEWGEKLNVKVIAHDYGSDPAAVAFDSIEYAKSHKLDVVLIDTAGRQHSNKDLVREMEKIVRVTKPDIKIFVGEAITGNDCVDQAKEFNEAVNIDAIILAKADIDEKGGAIISISFVTHRPILYLGTGQSVSDLKEFDKEEIIKSLGF